jgi:hypothetical protein
MLALFIFCSWIGSFNLFGQGLIDISTQGKKAKMSSYLNGIGRNHVVGYNANHPSISLGTNIKEQRFLEKITLYNDIQNNFSSGGKKVYRLGHNISDGNLEFAFEEWGQPFGLLEPGWHWASQYGDGFISEYVNTILGNNPHGRVISQIGVPNNASTITVRLGAGTRRFIFTTDENQNHSQLNYSGFAVTINYDNHVGNLLMSNYAQLPKSTTIYTTGACFKIDSCWVDSTQNPPVTRCIKKDTTFAQAIVIPNGYFQSVVHAVPGCTVRQVGGPLEGQAVKKGWYEMNYRITHTNGAVGYWGFIICVSDQTIATKLVRQQRDTMLLLRPNPANHTLGTSALLRHSYVVTVKCTKLSTNPQANEMLIDSLGQYAAANDAPTTGQYGYDDIEYTMRETSDFQADLAIVANIATGYPEELVGLLEYLRESGVKVAFVELGSELMGTWNKGGNRWLGNECITPTPQNFTIGCTPAELASTTLPFALQMRNSPIKTISETKIALTNTYNAYFDFACFTGRPRDVLQAWIAPFLASNAVDYVNVHTYPAHFIGSQAFSAQKAINLVGYYQEFYTKTVPQVASLLQGTNVKIVITEVHTAYDALGGNAKTPPTDAQPSTMTEAIYFAEGFLGAAAQQSDAFIPFAFFKQGHPTNHNCSSGGDYCVQYNDPSSSGSWTTVGEDPSQQIHFYNNTTETDKFYKDVFLKPVFKAKKMTFENLGNELITNFSLQGDSLLTDNSFEGHSPYDTTGLNQAPYQVQFSRFGVLPTYQPKKGTNEASVQVLIIGRDAKNPWNYTPLRIRIDSVEVDSAEIMVLAGGSHDDKQPRYTKDTIGIPYGLNYNFAGTPNAVVFNQNMPQYQSIKWVANQGLPIPNYSICVLKVPVSRLIAPIVCPASSSPSAPTGIGISCDAIKVDWTNLGNSTYQTQSFGLYYYEQADGQGIVPTTLNLADPKWKHYGDFGNGCLSATINGLQFPQDEYQIAVVTRYGIQLPNFIGPKIDSITCITSVRTGWCEDRIDKAHISGLSPTGSQCINNIFNLGNVQFCGAQMTQIPVVTQCDKDFEIALSGDFKVDAVRLYCGTKPGSIEVSVDNGTGYQNNPLLTALSGTDTWMTLPIKTAQGCSGIEHVQRIRFRLQHGDDQIRKLVLQGKPLDGISNANMPICCGSKSAIPVTAGTLREALNNAVILPGQAQELVIQPASKVFMLNANHTFNGCKIYLDADVQLVKPTDSAVVNIQFLNTSLRGCEYRWKGIELAGTYELSIQNSQLMDMDEGLVLTPRRGVLGLYLTKTGIEQSVFSRNKASIRLQGGDPQALFSRFYKVSNFMRSVVIDGTDLNLKPIKGQNAGLNERAEFGFQSILMNQVVVGDTRLQMNGLDIRNVQRPVFIDQCNSVMLNNVLVNNEAQPSTVAMYVNKTKLFFLTNNYSSSTNPLYLAPPAAHISGVKDAIRIQTVGLTSITGVVTNQVRNGVLGRGGLIISNYLIDNNVFNVESSGILVERSAANAVFSRNGINQYVRPLAPTGFAPTAFQNSLYGGLGIGLALGTQAQIFDNKIDVRRNPAYPDAVHGGIVLLRGKSHSVKNNRISLQNNIIENDPRFYGIYSLSHLAAGHAFCGNGITGLQGYDRGIGANNGINSLYTCNSISNTRQPLYYLGNNQNQDAITGNTLADSPFGVYINSDKAAPVVLGEQDRRANQFINNWSNGGFWEGVQTIPNPNGGQNIRLIDLSKFINNENAPFWPITISSPSDWFVQTTDPNEPIGCSPGLQANCQGVNPPVVAEPPVVGIGKLAENASALQEPYRSTVLRQTYAQAKANYPDGNYPQEIQAFVSHHEQAGFAQLATLDGQMDDLLYNAPNVKVELANAETAIRLTFASYNAFLKDIDHLTFDERLNNQTVQPPYVTVFEDRLVQFADLQESATVIANQNMDALIAANNQLQPDNAYIALEQEVNSLTWAAMRDSRDLTVTELEYIKSIADKCPQEYGDAVAKARATWLAHGGGLQKAWELCNLDMQETQSQGKSVLQTSQPTELPQINPNELVVYPVPLADLFKVSIPSEYVGAEYQLIASTGTVVSRGTFKSTMNELDCTTCATGIYLIRVNHPKYRPVNLKIVVQKL